MDEKLPKYYNVPTMTNVSSYLEGHFEMWKLLLMLTHEEESWVECAWNAKNQFLWWTNAISHPKIGLPNKWCLVPKKCPWVSDVYIYIYSPFRLSFYYSIFPSQCCLPFTLFGLMVCNVNGKAPRWAHSQNKEKAWAEFGPLFWECPPPMGLTHHKIWVDFYHKPSIGHKVVGRGGLLHLLHQAWNKIKEGTK